MELNSVLAAVGKMFPSANLNGAVQKAREALAETTNSLDGARATAKKFGITPQAVNEIYQKYGGTMQGRAVCGLLGTTPEALKADADMILSAGSASARPAQKSKQSTSKFPRLK